MVVFLLLRPKSLPNAERKVDFFRWGVALSWLCLLGASLTTEYRMVDGNGLVVRLAAGGGAVCVLTGDDLTGEALSGEDLGGEAR